MFRLIDSHDVPGRDRKTDSLFESAREWKALKDAIDAGLPKGKSAQVLLSAEDWERIGLSGEPQEGRNTSVGSKSARRFIEKYLLETRRKYTVRVFHKGGFDNIIVGPPNRGAKRKAAPR